ncbi:MAG TPA: 50S ribosomal protein L1 [Candidatus Nitrosotenuis sp.]|nr:50S ribosomal protein L1 [Candidatus Nitrosotenuis sp.]HIH46377.1 50S ribosomal protein L1 [Candidatus Nitrosotenuis sp.]HIH68218.1 50S ribosomal protein L1 [Candidatus Nitrosotenuis sp.]HII03855.1 50S ribosomal protein L1 [Candidatus Nitrosotenuis sp.]
MINEAELSKLIKDAKSQDKERKFKQTLEMYVILKDIDVKKGFAMNETIQLPKRLSQPTTVCVMAGGDMGLKAKSANADRVVSGDELNTIAANKREARKFINNYDFFLADTQLMTTVGKVLGQLLGPRGKMPIPVPFNAPIESFLDRFRSSIRVKVKNSLSMSCKIGDESMDDGDVAANAHAILNAIEKKLPSGDKNIRKIIVKTSMGKPVKQSQQAKK